MLIFQWSLKNSYLFFQLQEFYLCCCHHRLHARFSWEKYVWILMHLPSYVLSTRYLCITFSSRVPTRSILWLRYPIFIGSLSVSVNNGSFWDPNHFNIVAIFPKIACRYAMSFSSTIKACNERRIIFLCRRKEIFIKLLLCFWFISNPCFIKNAYLIS